MPNIETPLNISYHTPRMSLDEEATNRNSVILDRSMVRRRDSDTHSQNRLSQAVDRAEIAPEAEGSRHHSELSTKEPTETGSSNNAEPLGGLDNVVSEATDGEETGSVSTAPVAHETEDDGKLGVAIKDAPPFSSTTAPTLPNVGLEFLVLSKISPLINSELKTVKDIQGSPKASGISRLYNNRVSDTIFNAITTLGPIFPKGPRDYLVYTKTMDRMARIFEQRGHSVGAMIALSLLKRAFGKRHSQVTMACKCTCTYKLALIFDQRGEDSLAESHYRSAFEGFQALEEEARLISQKRQNYQLRCELSFARFLRRVGNKDEALNVLVSGFIKALSRSCEAPATQAQLERILSSLDEISDSIDTDGYLAKDLADLRKHVFNRPLYKVAYFDLIKLANTFSFLGRFDDADLIFDFAFPKILRVENWNLKKAQMALYYAEHYQRHNEWAQSLKPLRSAFESLLVLFEKLALVPETNYIRVRNMALFSCSKLTFGARARNPRSSLRPKNLSRVWTSSSKVRVLD